MQKLIAKVFLIGVLLISCNEDQIQVDRQELPKKISFTSLDKEPKLKQAIESIGLHSKFEKSGRLMSGVDEFRPDSIIKVLQSDSVSYTYTLSLNQPKNPWIFRDLVFQRVSNGFIAFVLEYKQKSGFSDFTNFTGVITQYNLEGDVMSSKNMLNGTPVSDSNSGGRTQCIEIALYREHPNGGNCWDGVGLAVADNCYLVIRIEDCGGGSSTESPASFIPDTSTPIDGSGGTGGGSTGGGDSGGRDGLSEPIGVSSSRLPGNEARLNFLSANPDIANSVYSYLAGDNNNTYLQEDVLFASELIDLAIAENDSQFASRLVNIALVSKANGYFHSSLDANFLALIDPYVDLDLTDQTNHDALITFLIVKYQVLKALNPEWSETKVFWETVKDVVHIGLDVFGLLPVIGEAGDLVNGVLYSIEGDGLNASLSYASAIPIVGYGSISTKYGLKIINAVSDINSKVKLVWKVTADGISFGSRSQLRKVLNLAPGDPRQAHHIIPWAKQNHSVIQKAAKSDNAFHMNEALNGIPVEAWRNQPNHDLYDQKVQALLNSIPENLSPNETYIRFNSIINDIRNAIVNNPNTHLNDLIF